MAVGDGYIGGKGWDSAQTKPIDPVFVQVLNNGLAAYLNSLIHGENETLDRLMTAPSYSYNNITTATTTVVKSGVGILHSITINQAVASSVITIFDNTAGSGTKIGTITLPATLLDNHVTLTYDVAFATGLTIVTATGASDITVSYI